MMKIVLTNRAYGRSRGRIGSFAGMLLLSLLTTVGVCSAAPQTKWRCEKKSLVIPAKGAITVAAPPLKTPSGSIGVLIIQVRLHYAGGSNKNLRLTLNGKPIDNRVGESRFGGGLRILNKKDSTYRGAGESYFSGNALTIPFGTSFSKVGEYATYMLDVSDLLNANKPNVLKIGNTSVPKHFKLPVGGKRPELVIGRLELATLPVAEADASALRKAEAPPARISGSGIRLGNTEILVSSGGGIELRSGKTSYFLEGEFSRPGGGKNALRVDGVGVGWRKVTVVDPICGTITVIAEDPSYRLTRRVSVKGGRIELHDTFENLTDRVIGVAVTNSIIPSKPPRSIYLGGIDGRSEHGSPIHPAPNPTVFYAGDSGGLGITPEDTIVQLQLRISLMGRKCEFRAHHFGLKPRASYTMRWAMYPEDKPSYWSFINRLRNDWGVNRTIDNYGFYQSLRLSDSDDRIRTFFGRRGMKIAIPGRWWGHIYGFRGTPEEQVKILRKARDRIKEICPDMRVVCKIQPLLSAASPKGEDPHKDSQIIRSNGKPLMYPCTGECYKDVPEGWVRYRHVPVLGNSWHKQLEQWVRLAMTKGEFDGVFFDTFSCAHGYGRYTYDLWDGHTVNIDPKTGEVTRKYSDLALISEPSRLALIKLIRSYGGIAIANDAPRTLDMTRNCSLRVNETGTPYGYARLHLSTLTPLSYHKGYGVLDHLESDRMADLRHKLASGCLYSFYYGAPHPTQKLPTCWMYPITPTEIGPGWVKGEERTVTMVSGEYGWGLGTVGQALLFDKNGHRVKSPTAGAIQPTRNGVKIQIPEGGLGIIIRKTK